MTNVYTSTFASPLKGVSQQNPRDRIDGQCEEQINLIADPVRSLTIRPPVEFVKALRDTDNDITDILFSYANNTYLVSLKEGYASLYNISTGETYTLEGDVPEYVVSGMTLSANASTILLLNKNKVVKMADTLSTAQNKTFVVQCKGGVSDTTYGIKIVVDGKDFTKTYKVTSMELGTADNVTTKLRESFTSDTGFTAYFDVSQAYDCLLFSLKDKSKTYTVSTTDGYGGRFLIAAISSVSQSAYLPRYAPNGYVLQVEQLPETKINTYYMKYVIRGKGDGEGFGSLGAWAETTAVGIKNEFDKSTMPHELVINNETKTFKIQQAAWYPRRTGDEKTNPKPSFVGNTINDIDIIQGRVALASKSFFLTRSKEPLDCYRNSATVLVDSDPIDIENTVSVGNKIEAIIQYAKKVSLYAQEVQFLTDASSALNPVNTSMPISSNFSYDGVKPVTTGMSVIHSYKKGEYTALVELFPATSQNETPFANVTEQVERYLKGGCRKLISNLAFDNIFVLTDADKKVMYCYKYLFTNNQKILSAWSTYKFLFDIDNVFSYQDTLYLVYSVAGKTYLGRMSLDYPVEEGLDFTIFLDNKTTMTVVNGVGTLPFTPTLSDYVCVLVKNTRDVTTYSGLPYEIESIVGNTLTLKDKTITGEIVIGLPISWEYVPTRPYVRDADGNIDDTGKLNIIRYDATLENTSSFNVGIFDLLGNQLSYEVSANRANFSIAELDKVNLINDTVALPFNRESARYNIKLFGSSYTPFTLVDLAYTFKFYRR